MYSTNRVGSTKSLLKTDYLIGLRARDWGSYFLRLPQATLRSHIPDRIRNTRRDYLDHFKAYARILGIRRDRPLIAASKLRELLADERLKIRIKVENLLLVNLGVRPCSQTTIPVDLPGGEEMGRRIDEVMAPKMAMMRAEADPKKRLAAIFSLKNEMRTVYNEVVADSEQYEAHFNWARDLELRSRVVDVRPTVQEFYMFRERGTGGKLRKLMKERGKIRARAYSSAQPGINRVHLAFPEEFDGSWLKEMGEVLGYPSCCYNAYASDRENGLNVETRAVRQLEEAESLGVVDPLAYFVGYFFPCCPDCDEALAKGRESLSLLSGHDSSLGEIYVSLVTQNKESVLRQLEVISQYKARAEGRPFGGT